MDERTAQPRGERARVLLERGRASCHEGDYALALDCYRHSLRLARRKGDRPGIAGALLELADLALECNPGRRHNSQRHKARCEEALALYRELGDRSGEARALRTLSWFVPGEEGAMLMTQSLSVAREAADKEYSHIAPTHMECARLNRPNNGDPAGRPADVPAFVVIGSEDVGRTLHVAVTPDQEAIYYLEEGEEAEDRLVASGYSSIYHYLLALRRRFS